MSLKTEAGKKEDNVMVHKKDHEWKIVTVSKQVLKSNDVCFFV